MVKAYVYLVTHGQLRKAQHIYSVRQACRTEIGLWDELGIKGHSR